MGVTFFFFFLRILLYFFLCKISRLARIKALSVPLI
jgi:Na+-transporting methylmalonyl-CoA/oxaloacetate decarboxylase gamma subunit